MRRGLTVGLMAVLLWGFSVSPAFAAPSDFFFILPRTAKTESECDVFLTSFEQEMYRMGASFDESLRGSSNDVLGCAIKTGRIHFNYIPFYVKGLIEFLLGLAGLLSVVFIIVGGYKLLFGGLLEEKDSGKKTLTYAIGGLIVSLLAWSIVNIVTLVLTS